MDNMCFESNIKVKLALIAAYPEMAKVFENVAEHEGLSPYTVFAVFDEAANVDFPLGVNSAVQLRIDEDRFIPGLALLREALHDAAPICRVALQINHPGGQTKQCYPASYMTAAKLRVR